MAESLTDLFAWMRRMERKHGWEFCVDRDYDGETFVSIRYGGAPPEYAQIARKPTMYKAMLAAKKWVKENL